MAFSATERSGIRTLLRSLHSRNYRLFVAGQSVSLIGTWMQQVAMSWLTYRLTSSAFLLGVVGFTSQIPTFLLAPVAGVLADRWNRRRLLVMTQTLAMCQAALLAAAVFSNIIQVWHLIVLSLVLGTVNAFDVPVRQSFVVEMVPNPSDLGNAIALNSSMVQAARLVGPAIAGLLVASAGEGVCFLLNSVSYLAVLLALVAMRLGPAPHQERPKRHILYELQDGVAYAFGFTPIRSILLLVSLVSLTGMPYMVLAPVYAREVLHGGAHTFGFLMTAAGCGALIGTMSLASRTTVLGLGRIIAVAPAILATGIAAFALSSSLTVSLLALMVAGYGAVTLVASANTILQTILDEDKRGRVMSFFTMSFMGMTPFGSFCAGTLASMIGTRSTLLIGAACCLTGAAIFSARFSTFRELIRPVYIARGIITDNGPPHAPHRLQTPDA
jgi:MFS family permease